MHDNVAAWPVMLIAAQGFDLCRAGERRNHRWAVAGRRAKRYGIPLDALPLEYCCDRHRRVFLNAVGQDA